MFHFAPPTRQDCGKNDTPPALARERVFPNAPLCYEWQMKRWQTIGGCGSSRLASAGLSAPDGNRTHCSSLEGWGITVIRRAR